MKRHVSIALVVAAVLVLAAVGLVVRGLGPSLRSLTGRHIGRRAAPAFGALE